MAIFQNINSIKYKNNYQILFYFAEPKRGLYFEPVSNCWIPSTKNDVKFIINNKLIKKE